MSTPFSNIYNLFLDSISDYTFLDLDIDVKNSILKGYLIKAVINFKKSNTDLSRNDDTEVFTNDLTEEEQFILSQYMVMFWMIQQIYNINLLRQRMSSKDFKLTSQAQHLETLLKLKKEHRKEIDSLVRKYVNDLYNLDDDLE